MERPYLLRACEVAGDTAHVLELGCGSGQPVARFFIERGDRVTGVDFSTEMLEISRARFPEMRWIQADMRKIGLEEEFDTLIAWDSFFHLSPDDQRKMFPIFQRHLRIGGALMFTSGVYEAEQVGGDLFGDVLYHASLDSAEYADQLERHGFEVVVHNVEDPECGGHTVWIAQRIR